MNKIIIFSLFGILLANCSLDTKSGIWTKEKKITQNQSEEIVIFEDKKILNKELNPSIKINIKSMYKSNSFLNNLTNNNGNLNYEGNFKKISKYKFSKINEFNFTQPDILFLKDNSIIFFDKKGSIIKFNENSKIIWKKNHYVKNEKKLNPTLFFASDDKHLIVADTLANYYLINILNGELIWKKNNISPFNSQIQLKNGKFFVVDFDNVLRCYSIRNGKELWHFKTEKSFIKSQQKLSIVIKENSILFINTLGDVSALNLDNGNLIWQTPTQSNEIYEDSFTLRNSDLVIEKNTIYFSNNKNEFYAIDFKTGVIKWKQNINSSLRSTIIEDLIFVISNEGLFFLIDASTGNLLRITDIFKSNKNLYNKKISPTGFVVAKNKIYLSLNNGKLVVVDIVNGRPIKIIKIDGEKISRPYIVQKSMYVLKDNGIIKIN